MNAHKILCKHTQSFCRHTKPSACTRTKPLHIVQSSCTHGCAQHHFVFKLKFGTDTQKVLVRVNMLCTIFCITPISFTRISMRMPCESKFALVVWQSSGSCMGFVCNSDEVVLKSAEFRWYKFWCPHDHFKMVVWQSRSCRVVWGSYGGRVDV